LSAKSSTSTLRSGEPEGSFSQPKLTLEEGCGIDAGREKVLDQNGKVIILRPSRVSRTEYLYTEISSEMMASESVYEGRVCQYVKLDQRMAMQVAILGEPVGEPFLIRIVDLVQPVLTQFVSPGESRCLERLQPWLGRCGIKVAAEALCMEPVDIEFEGGGALDWVLD